MTAMTAPERRTPRAPRLDRATAMVLAATEYDRFVNVLGELDVAEWGERTDCPAWDVRDMAGHVLGSMRMCASLLEQQSQLRAARRRGGDLTDALSAEQVQRCSGLSVERLLSELTRTGPRAARGRRRTPGFVRRRALPATQLVGAQRECWTVGYLIDIVLTRDTWMHRLDICRATGRSPVLAPEHDGIIIDDLVHEWAERHGQAYRLTLEGPAGGVWQQGQDGVDLRLDAVEFARLLSGRGRSEGLLAVPVPF
jgi:uncharacterized protein (TIGR03083 family)